MSPNITTRSSMDLKDLSSNWKKLQEALKKDTSKPPKRKATNNVLQPHQNSVKRRKEVHSIVPGPWKGTSSSNIGNMAMLSSSNKEFASSASLALWAEDNDISPQDLADAYGTPAKSRPLIKTYNVGEKTNEGLSSIDEAGKYIALDCEMVGVGPKPEKDSALARISVVDYHGNQLYDSFVLPKEPVTDYRTFVSGITPRLLQTARTLEAVQADVAKLLDGRILVGHAIRYDLDALLLGHPKRDIRDTSRYPGFRKLAGGKTPSLKKLARDVLGVDIQGGEHSSVEDARATMLIFRKEKEGFERVHAKAWGNREKPDRESGNDGSKISSKKGKNKKARKGSTLLVS